jgi:hypothetical protein
MISRIRHGHTTPSDYEVCVVPPKARAILSHFDERSQHYEVRERLTS